MAVAPTGAIYKSLIFDGEDSRDYGVYITGEAVYNAPERDIEMIAIPGRNGAFALDNGRFENIEVIYPAGIFADNETDFAAAISDFRNFLCSKKGYCRLEDGYNPDEYRMALYKSGLEVSPTQLTTGEFEIIFDCKPQRFLTSGETAVTVANNGTLTNPTLFDSQPLIAAEGYGNISFGDFSISITNEEIGDIMLWNPESTTRGYLSGKFNKALVSNGDIIKFQPLTVQLLYRTSDNNLANATCFDSGSGTGTTEVTSFSSDSVLTTTTITGIQFTAGTQTNPLVHTITITLTLSDNSEYTIAENISFAYSPNTGEIGIFATSASGTYISSITIATNGVTAVSTATILGHPTYIDCELGEAYKIENSEIVSLNRYIDLGSDLPVLSPGSNTITKSNTITQLKFTPRWWKV